MSKKTMNKYIESKCLLFHSHLHCITYLLLFVFFSTTLFYIYIFTPLSPKYTGTSILYMLHSIIFPTFYPFISTRHYDVKLFLFTLLYTTIDIYIYIYPPKLLVIVISIRLYITIFLVFYD